MRSFSIKCITINEAYVFGRLAERLGIKWRNREIFTTNTTRWHDHEERTHYNIHTICGEARCTYGKYDDSIDYTLVTADDVRDVQSWDEMDELVRIKKEEQR